MCRNNNNNNNKEQRTNDRNEFTYYLVSKLHEKSYNIIIIIIMKMKFFKELCCCCRRCSGVWCLAVSWFDRFLIIVFAWPKDFKNNFFFLHFSFQTNNAQTILLTNFFFVFKPQKNGDFDDDFCSFQQQTHTEKKLAKWLINHSYHCWSVFFYICYSKHLSSIYFFFILLLVNVL